MMSFGAVALAALGCVAAYLLGSINFGILVSKGVFHDDVRSKGSGNPGSTNMLRNYGLKGAALTFVGDMGKGALAALLGQWIFAYLGWTPVYGGFLLGVFAALGHMFPVFFHWKGGKSVATAAGSILVTEWPVLLVLLVIFVVVVAVSRIVSLSSVTVAAAYPIATAVWTWQTGHGWFPFLCALFVGVLVIWAHRANIQRIRNGTEYKFVKKK